MQVASDCEHTKLEIISLLGTASYALYTIASRLPVLGQNWSGSRFLLFCIISCYIEKEYSNQNRFHHKVVANVRDCNGTIGVVKIAAMQKGDLNLKSEHKIENSSETASFDLLLVFNKVRII